jgi:SAM-dependent methyltransferase
MSPFANAYLKPDQLDQAEPFYPLHALVCDACMLVQLAEFQSPSEIFSDYAYFSSVSESWVRHARAYTVAMRERLALGPESLVVEIASNDGYLLQHFLQAGVPVLGIEPAANVAEAAKALGISTVVEFFGSALARRLAGEGRRPDLLLGNNVLAHVPDLNDFVAGVKLLLGPRGVATFEFPHLERLMAETQFDTIYHEHFCYFSLLAVKPIFERHGLSVFDVEELPTHGGSLRLFVQHLDTGPYTEDARVGDLLEREAANGLGDTATYDAFAEKVRETKRRLLGFLIDAKRAGKSIVGYGAPAKGNTLLNFCGVRGDFLDYVVDRSPHKQGQYLPGVHIPIEAPERIAQTRPDYVLILPWNIKEEVMRQMAHVRDWGGRFVAPIPTTEVLD